jgi:hypothetical protein
VAGTEENEDAGDTPVSRRIYRCWVELRDRRDGSVRELPLTALRLIHLPAKKNAPRLPDEQMLRLEDGAEIVEARDLDELIVQLRAKYPDETHERFLRQVRDREAEQRKTAAMKCLQDLLVEVVLRDLMQERGGSADMLIDENARGENAAAQRRQRLPRFGL